MRISFYARGYTEMVVEVVADEQTSEVLPEYFENYFGHEGTLTLRHVQSNSTLSVQLYPIEYNTFEGVVPLPMMQFGLYQLQGRVRDIVGNYAVLSDYYIDTDEPVQLIEVLLEVGYNIIPIISVVGKYKPVFEITGSYITHYEVVAPSYSSLLNVEVVGKYEKEMVVPCQNA